MGIISVFGMFDERGFDSYQEFLGNIYLCWKLDFCNLNFKFDICVYVLLMKKYYYFTQNRIFILLTKQSRKFP